jgi:hypothetical protein
VGHTHFGTFEFANSIRSIFATPVLEKAIEAILSARKVSKKNGYFPHQYLPV